MAAKPDLLRHASVLATQTYDGVSSLPMKFEPRSTLTGLELFITSPQFRRSFHTVHSFTSVQNRLLFSQGQQ